VRLTSLAAVVVVALALATGRADAYPELQFSTGATRCSECHLSPVGGGLLSEYGREEAGDTISGGGDGRLLHGLVDPPSWLAIGGDLRLGALARRSRGSEAAVFPMQADVYARVGAKGLTVEGTFGVLAAIRDPEPIGQRLGSREHYVQYEAEHWYARAGRFYPAFGLRLPDHTAYVRRFTGLHSLEESYAAGGGYKAERWELHASLLSPLEVAPVVGRHGWGAAVQYERFTDAGAWGASAKAVNTVDGLDAWVGLTGKRWLEGPRLLLLAEVDGGHQQVEGAGAIPRLALYAAAHYRPEARWGGSLGLHLYDPDLQVGGQTSAGVEATVTIFPRAHWELAALLRGEVVSTDHASAFGLLQLHYYL